MPFHNPFASLAHLRGDQPEAAPADAPTPDPPAASVVRVPRAVVQLQRAGRGKEVTVVTQLNLNEAERDRWLKALKSSLGCGCHVEGDTLVLQGDQRDRVRAWLSARGVRKVT